MKQKIQRSSNADTIYLLEAFADFVEAKEAQNLATATLHNYQQSNQFFFSWLEADSDTDANSIEEKTIYAWINHMRKEDLSAAAINHYIRDVRAFLYWCMDREYMKTFKIKCIEQQEEPPKFFTDDELELLLEKPRRSDTYAEWRTYTIICFILATGARPQTVCDLKVNDIDFSRKEITYHHVKTKKAMIVPLSSGLETTLREFIRMWRVGGNWLFANVGDEKLTVNALRLSFQRYTKSRGVEKSNIYGLRHTFARGWCKNNGSVFALQKMLGHEDIAMTKRYVKLYAADIKEDLEDFTVLDNMKKAKSRKQRVEKSEKI